MTAAAPIDTTYDDVQAMVRSVVGQFVARYGGNYEDYLSEANMVFLRVYENFTPGRGSFHGLLSVSIRNRLLDMRQRDYRYARRKEVSYDEGMDSGIVMDVTEIVEELTSDAKQVLDLVFSTPAELAAAVRGRGGEARNWRSCLREYLVNLGWSASRIAGTFEEIKSALV